MTLFNTKLDKNNRLTYILGVVGVFALMTGKSYVQLELAFAGRMLELLLMLVIAWCVNRIIKKDYITALGVSFWVNAISIPIYILVAQSFSNIQSDEVFRQAEFITSVSLTFFYGGLWLLLLKNNRINELVRDLIVRFKWILFSIALLMYDAIIIASVFESNPYFSKGFYYTLIPVFSILIISGVYMVYKKEQVK